MGNEVEQIKQQLDIVDIVKDYVQLKVSGSNHKGLCPFHQEKSGSFMVSAAKQIYHCFGCHKGGDMISFIQEIEGIEFYDALKILGDRAGVKIEKKQAKSSSKKDEILSILQFAAKFYHKILLDHPKAEEARAYLQQRAVSGQTQEVFQLGFAPDSWDVLLTALQKKGFSPQAIKACGLMVENKEKNSIYDRFRGRLMIPLRDAYGKVVGFTARAIQKEFTGGKYINTPQTEVYDKSRVLFGFSFAKQAIKEQGEVVVVEGNMDVVASHQAGVKHVVAVSGTALTDQQLGLIKRFTQKLVMAFDEDAAGINAMKRSLPLALAKGFEVRVLSLPNGKDPDDCIQEDPNLWKQAIQQAEPLVDAVLSRALKQYDISTPQGKKQVADDVLVFVKALPSAVMKDHYMQLLSRELQVSETSLKTEMAQKETIQVEKSQEVVKPQAQKAPPKEVKLSRDLLALIVKKPMILEKSTLSEEAFPPGLGQDLYKRLKTFYSENTSAENKPFSKEAFLQSLPEELQEYYNKLELFLDKEFADISDSDHHDAFKARHDFLKRIFLRRQLQRVQTAMKDAEKSNDTATIESLMNEFRELTAQLSTLGQI